MEAVKRRGKMLVVIKGAGDLASGIAYRLKKCGFNIVMTETQYPTVIRHTVAFASAVYMGTASVEDEIAVLCKDIETIEGVLKQQKIAVIVDEKARCIKELKPDVVVDAIIAKYNLGTHIMDAKKVIGVGPGFTVGKDCHFVIETKRGHDLGRVRAEGSAFPNTGIPGNIGGYTNERIIRAPQDGVFQPKVAVGQLVEASEIIAYVDDTPIYAALTGVVRGILFKPMQVKKGFKCGDIDPRGNRDYCYTISDKARAIGGGVLEAILRKE